MLKEPDDVSVDSKKFWDGAKSNKYILRLMEMPFSVAVQAAFQCGYSAGYYSAHAKNVDDVIERLKKDKEQQQ